MQLRARPFSYSKARGLIVACTALLLTAVMLAGGFDGVDRNAFDLMSTIAPPHPQQPGTVIVAIDEPSFSALGKPWPWSRDVHANLIHSLRKAGAKSIGIDVVFADPTNAAADEALAAAVDRNTILGVDETVMDTPQGSMLVRTEPLPALIQRGARPGVSAVTVDADGVVRHIPRYPDSFAQQFLGALSHVPGDRLIQYFGGRGTYPYVSYYQALDPNRYLPPGIFRGRDVIVGLVVQANPDVRQTDAFETPFTPRDHQLVPGAEIQATMIDNLRHGLWIAPSAPWLPFLLLIAGCALGYASSTPERLLARLAAALGLGIGTVLLAWLTLRLGRVWASPVEPLSGLVLSFTFVGVADFAAERRRRRGIQNAFSRYVAPEIVSQIVDDPDRVKLQGERKMITVLFADVRGFTAISEALLEQPEQLTQFVNEVLNILSDIVTSHGGTIDKYIGDCVMAFWNAPLDDPDHASHAVGAALEMIQRIGGLDREAGNIDRPVEIGVGVNSGECVVGNMGSHQRFDYTVIGDPVNVASRLEGLSKEYGVPLLIGSDTARTTRDRFDYVELGSIRVRGKRHEQMVYTISDLLSPSASLAQESGDTDG